MSTLMQILSDEFLKHQSTRTQRGSLDELRLAVSNAYKWGDDVQEPEVEKINNNELKGQWLHCHEGRGAILRVHGGGYCFGSADMHSLWDARLMDACQASVFSVDYRLAPEHPCPAAIEDCLQAYQHMLANGFEAENMVFLGDSAGGGLVLSMLLQLGSLDLPKPAGAILVSPWLDLSLSGNSIQTNQVSDPVLLASELSELAGYYCGSLLPEEPLASPLFEDLSGLPPLHIQVIKGEILYDDAVRLKKRATSCGSSVELHTWDEGFHIFQGYSQLPESRQSDTMMAAFFDSVVKQIA